MIRNIINKLSDILDANDDIQEVFKYEVEQFTGDPGVTIVPSANDSDYETTEENVRIYAFTVRLFVNRTLREKKEADEVLSDLVDSVLDDFDKYYGLSATGTDGSAIPGGAIVNPAGYLFINIFAVPSVWGYVGREDEYRSCELTIRARVNIDLTSIN